ncbi:MAG: ankyrin repeat domain-containing protein, partial [Bacteroidota bacterium]
DNDEFAPAQHQVRQGTPIFNSQDGPDENNIDVSINLPPQLNLPPQHFDDDQTVANNLADYASSEEDEESDYSDDFGDFNINAPDQLENEEDEDNENSAIASVIDDVQTTDNKFDDYANYAYASGDSDDDEINGIDDNDEFAPAQHQVRQGTPIFNSQDGPDENNIDVSINLPPQHFDDDQTVANNLADYANSEEDEKSDYIDGLANLTSIKLGKTSDKMTEKHEAKRDGDSQNPKVDYKFIGFDSSNSKDNVAGVYRQIDEFTQRIIWLYNPNLLRDSKKHILGMKNPRRQPNSLKQYPPEREGDKVTSDALKYTGLTQSDIVDLIGSDLVEQVTSISFPFNSDTLAKVFPRVINPGHMIHITSDMHAFAVVCKEEAIFLYEPTGGVELKFSYNELEPLSERILHFGKGNNSKNINLNVLRRKDIKSQGQEQINPLDLAKTSNISPRNKEQAYEAFASALGYGQIDLIKHYVENYKLDLNQPLEKIKADDRPPLMHAIKKASQTHQDKASEIVSYLLSKGANVNVPIANGATLLTIAADRGLDRVMQVLLSHPGFKYSRDVNEAIGYAIEYDHRHIVAAALNNPNFPLKSQVVVKAIQYAVEYGYPGILDLALKQKCLDQDDRRTKILAAIPKDFSDSNKKEEKEEILDLNLPSDKSGSLKKLAPIDKDFIAPSDVDKQKKVDLNLPAHAVKGLGESLIDQAYKTAGKELVESIYNEASAEGINKAEDLQKIAKIGGTKEIVWKFLAKLANEGKLKTVLDPLASKDILQHWAPEITDTFKAAYLDDIQYSSAFLDNAEGQALSQILKVNAKVFALPGQQVGKKFITPDGDRYEAIKVTPADGHCLIHGMYLIQNKEASPEEIWDARRKIANNINQNALKLQLQGYIGDALSGLPQASGLGDRTKALLQSNSAISQGKDEKAKPKSPLKKKKEKEKLPKEKLPEVNPEIPFGYQRIFPNTVYGDENNLHGYLVFVNRNHYVQVVPEGPQQVGLGNNDNHNKSKDKKQSKSQDEEHNKSKLKKDKVSKYKSTEELLVILNDMQTSMKTTLWDKVLQLNGKVEHTVTGAITKYLKEHGVSIVKFESAQVEIKDAHTNHKPLKDMVKQIYNYYNKDQ